MLPGSPLWIAQDIRVATRVFPDKLILPYPYLSEAPIQFQQRLVLFTFLQNRVRITWGMLGIDSAVVIY